MELNIGQKSKLLRALCNLSQKGLAGICGCTPKQLSILESNGESTAFPKASLEKLIALFENTLKEFNTATTDITDLKLKKKITAPADTKSAEEEAADLLRLKMKYD